MGEVLNSRNCKAIALSDQSTPDDLAIPVAALGGSRAKFAARTSLAGIRYSHFIYDFVGMARAHAALELLQKPFMTYIHGIEIWEEARADRIHWAQRANMLLANSQYTKERANRLHGGLDRARVCWLGTEFDQTPQYNGGQNDPVVLIVGRIVHGRDKGHESLIRSWPAVCQYVPNAVLRIVGDGHGRTELEQLADQSPVRQQIDFTGFVDEPTLEQAYRSAHLFAMPSRGEGFGLVYVEAMRNALPVIGSIHDAAGEIIVEGETGFLVDMDDPDQLANRVVQLLRDQDLAHTMGQAGQQRWQQHFSYSAFKGRFVECLTQFLNM